MRLQNDLALEVLKIMELFESSKLFLFIVFAIPGFIAMKTYSLLSPYQEKESTKLIIDAITYSCMNYAILGPIFYFLFITETNELKFTLWTTVFLIFAMFIFPIILASVWLWLRKQEFFRKNAPHPTPRAWDFVFSQGKSYYIIVTLQDGSKVAGKYSENSFTSSYPEEPQLYLEETWTLNMYGGFKRVRDKSEGILILSKDIQSIEFFEH